MLLHHTAHDAQAWLSEWKIEVLLAGTIGMLILLGVALAVDPDAVSATFAAFVAISPLWLPAFLFVAWWKIWMHYIRFTYWFRQPMVLLHIELPPEVTKSPLAMELFLVGLWNNGSETTFIQRIWRGQFRAITTLELVSNEGRIGFYIHLRRNWKEFIEARLYGQYPEAKISEVSDYVDEVPYNVETYDLWGTEYSKSEAAAFPIKTYLDYQMDKSPDTPEIQVDPLTNIFEFLGTVKKDEYVWIQIIMKARKKDEWYGFYKSGDSYKDGAKKQIKTITENAVKRAQELTGDDAEKKKVGSRGSTLMSPGEKTMIENIERSLTKQVFDCGFRAIYVVKKGKFDLSRVNNMVRLWDPFRGENTNKLNVTRGKAIFDYPWQDWKGIRADMISKKLFFWYKHRAYFYVPYDQDPVSMTTEELASIWHFPNSAVKTPALQRVPSRRAEAPINLPI